MDRLQKIGDAIEGFVVDQDRAEKRLLDFDVMRDLAMKRLVLGGNDVGKAHFVSGFLSRLSTPQRLPPDTTIERKADSTPAIHINPGMQMPPA